MSSIVCNTSLLTLAKFSSLVKTSSGLPLHFQQLFKQEEMSLVSCERPFRSVFDTQLMYPKRIKQINKNNMHKREGFHLPCIINKLLILAGGSMLPVLCLISLLGVLINTHPIDLGGDLRGGTDEPMVNAGFFGGDMAGFDPDDDNRNGVVGRSFVWPDGIIPFEIDQYLNFTRGLILKAMQHFHDVTCIRFVPRTTEKHYVYIVPQKGCWSHVGRQFGRQRLSLGPGCLYLGTIIHELNHAVGFWHEQNRPDRDEYIQILWENVAPGREHNFRKFNPEEVQLLNETYDIGSIMQYGETAFSISHSTPTIASISGEPIVDVHAKTSLSESDKRRIKNLYQC